MGQLIGIRVGRKFLGERGGFDSEMEGGWLRSGVSCASLGSEVDRVDGNSTQLEPGVHPLFTWVCLGKYLGRYLVWGVSR